MSSKSHPHHTIDQPNEVGSRRVFGFGMLLGILVGAIGGTLLESLSPEHAPRPDEPSLQVWQQPYDATHPERRDAMGPVDVPGAATSWIEGRLTDWSGRPIEGGQVRAVFEEDTGPARLPDASRGPGVESAREVVVATQADGRFLMLGLHAGGRYRLSGYPAPAPPRKQFDLRLEKGFPERTEFVVQAPAQDVKLPLVLHRVHVELLGPYEFLSEPGPDGRTHPVTFDVRITTPLETIAFDDLEETGFDLLVDPEHPIDLTIRNERMQPIDVRGFQVERSQLETSLPLHVDIRKTIRTITFHVRDEKGANVREAAIREIGLVGTETVASRAVHQRERTPLGLRFSPEGLFRVTAVEEGRRLFVVTGGDPSFLPRPVEVDVPYEGEIFEDVTLLRGGFLRVHMDSTCGRESYRVALHAIDGSRDEVTTTRFVPRGTHDTVSGVRLDRGKVYDAIDTLPEGRYELRLYEPAGTWRSYPLQINATQVTRLDVLAKLDPPPVIGKDG
ncbi:MAG: hypothetical protein H6834_04920 [Planctomycetes bacterium]|nr:hypothetical protein [Planctomycetota bacterium]